MADQASVERSRTKAVLKRDESIKRILAMHDLALRCDQDLSLVDQLSLLIDEIDDVWSKFTFDNDALLDSLIYLGREQEYPIDHAELHNLISVSRATLNRHMSSRSSNVSSRRGSLTSVASQEYAHGKHTDDSVGRTVSISYRVISTHIIIYTYHFTVVIHNIIIIYKLGAHTLIVLLIIILCIMR